MTIRQAMKRTDFKNAQIEFQKHGIDLNKVRRGWRLFACCNGLKSTYAILWMGNAILEEAIKEPRKYIYEFYSNCV